MSPDLPYVPKVGTDELSSLYNRILAIERIKHLSGVDLRDKSSEYKSLLDCELYIKFYKDFPAKTVDEEYCQRAAEIVKQFEKEKEEDLEKATEGATERVKQLYRESRNTAIPLEPSDTPPKFDTKQETWFDKIRNFILQKPKMVGKFFKCKTKKV